MKTEKFSRKDKLAIIIFTLIIGILSLFVYLCGV